MFLNFSEWLEAMARAADAIPCDLLEESFEDTELYRETVIGNQPLDALESLDIGTSVQLLTQARLMADVNHTEALIRAHSQRRNIGPPTRRGSISRIVGVYATMQRARANRKDALQIVLDDRPDGSDSATQVSAPATTTATETGMFPFSPASASAGSQRQDAGGDLADGGLLSPSADERRPTADGDSASPGEKTEIDGWITTQEGEIVPLVNRLTLLLSQFKALIAATRTKRKEDVFALQSTSVGSTAGVIAAKSKAARATSFREKFKRGAKS
jgi:hypothetical protein